MEKNTKYRTLSPLNNLDDWKVHHEDEDIRGWHLYTSRGEKIGEITNLIADTKAKKVRYAEVELDKSLNQHYSSDSLNRYDDTTRSYYGTDQDHHFLVPIGFVDIDKKDEKAYVSENWTLSHFANSPRYRGIHSQSLTPAYELVTVKYYADNDDEYRNDYYREEDYDVSQYNEKENIDDKEFYRTDFFNRNRYFERRKSSSNTMTSILPGQDTK